MIYKSHLNNFKYFWVIYYKQENLLDYREEETLNSHKKKTYKKNLLKNENIEFMNKNRREKNPPKQ